MHKKKDIECSEALPKNVRLLSGAEESARKLSAGFIDYPVPFDNPLNQTITSIDGIPVPMGNEVCEEIISIIRGGGDLNSVYTYCQNKMTEKSLTLKDAFKIALLKDRNPKDEIESFNNYELAIKINSGEELSLQDWPKIRSSVGKSWKHIPEILGFCWKYIDNLKVK